MKFRSTLCCLKLLNVWAEITGNHITCPAILPTSPVPAISPQTFTSVTGRYFPAHKTTSVVFTQQRSAHFSLAVQEWMGKHYPRC